MAEDFPFEEILAVLESTTIVARREGSSLIASNDGIDTILSIAEDRERSAAWNATLQTKLPEVFGTFPPSVFGRYPALGCVCRIGDGPMIQASTSLQRDDSEFESRLSLIIFSIIVAYDSFITAAGASIGRRQPSDATKSAWSSLDIRGLAGELQKWTFCTADDEGLTAEFGNGGHVSMIRVQIDQPHPGIGGGLLCRLHLRVPMANQDADRFCEFLNGQEFKRPGLPHFGTWFRLSDSVIVYPVFLPNALRQDQQIALLTCLWCIERAEWVLRFFSAK